MHAAYDKPPLLELYEKLNYEIKWMVKNKNSNSFPNGKMLNDDPVFKLILQNNSCPISDNAQYHEYKMEFVNDYFIIFMYGAKGNNVNKFFDYIEFFGARYLIIFMTDFFYIDDKIESEDEIFMGKSLYVEMIKKIVDVFLASTTCFAELNSSILSTTSAGNNYRFAGVFIAAKIIEPYCLNEEISDNDIDIIDPEELNKMLQLPLKLLLSGVKYTS